MFYKAKQGGRKGFRPEETAARSVQNTAYPPSTLRVSPVWKSEAREAR